MDRVWEAAARPGVARRHVFDARLAHTLLDSGVTELATRNTRDFDGFGFARVFDPIAAEAEQSTPSAVRRERGDAQLPRRKRRD
jgi:hypothetical protein